MKTESDRIQGEDIIAKTSYDNFVEIFTCNEEMISAYMSDCIARILTHDQNETLINTPTMKELKSVVFSMNLNSAAGPYRMSGYFFQKCWGIIMIDLMGVIKAFFNGQIIPKYLSQLRIVLLPKVSNPTKLTECRTIDLSNFTCKIIPKLVSSKLCAILPKLISPNQSGFVKVRSTS